MKNTLQSSNRPVPPSLRPLALGHAYSLLRGIAWSPDAELAVAADDAVHVFVPRLVGSDGNPVPIVDANDADLARNGDASAARPGPKPLADDFVTDTEARGQFTAHSRNIPIGAVPVPKGINSRLHALQTPLLSSILAAQQSPLDDEGAPLERTAASSVLRGTWDMTNAVVGIAWSPLGVGRHSRAVLSVLTSSGMLVVYGERLNGSDTSGVRGKGRGRQNYDTSQWEILWAAGTDAPVLAQTTDDRIVAFAWAGRWDGPSFVDGESADGEPHEISLRSLLVYMTDQDALVVLAVFHVHGHDGTVDWQVMEVARTRATRAPSADRDDKGIYDTAVDVQCSSWFTEKTEPGPYEVGKHAQTCLVGYIAGSYVGFLRISVQLPRQGEPMARFVHVDDNVTNGVCMDLLPNAFLRFEEGVWAVNSAQPNEPQSFVCRVAVATPMTVNELELEVETRGAGLPRDVLAPQVYPPTEARDCTNPITGLAIHPPNPESRTPLLYTVVRSACTSGHNTYGTTLPIAKAEGTPQWSDEITDRIRSSILSSGSIGRSGGTVPHVRFCGLAQAPAGLPAGMGVTAVLVEQHGAKGGVGSRYKQSRGSTNYVFFGWQDALPAPHETAVVGAHDLHAGRLAYQRPSVSTEAKMWTYMYGAGPPVVGRRVGELECSARVAELLINKAVSQRCSICDRAVQGHDAVTSICAAGHKFARCSATGLAIVRPNASHACGVCGSRTMHLGTLLGILNEGAAEGVEVVDKKDMVALRHEVLGDVCKRCGGKFYD